MSKKIDKVRERLLQSQEFATKLVKIWAEAMLAEYNEPSRVRIPKGNPIGLSRKKYHTALLMTLHPGCLKLKEIGEITGVSEKQVTVWRTQDSFRKAISQACAIFGEMIAGTVRNLILAQGEIELGGQKFHQKVSEWEGKPVIELYPAEEDEIATPSFMLQRDGKDDPQFLLYLLPRILPFLNPMVYEPVAKELKTGMDENLVGYAGFGLGVFRGGEVKDKKSLRKWLRRPDILALNKEMVGGSIDDLIESIKSKKMTEAEIKKAARDVKNLVNNLIDVLAE